MKLVGIIEFLRKGGTYSEFCHTHGINEGSEVVEMYMEKPFKIENDIVFFEHEVTNGAMKYFHKGRELYNLVDVYLFLEFVDASRHEGHKSDSEIGYIFWSYLMNYACVRWLVQEI